MKRGIALLASNRTLQKFPARFVCLVWVALHIWLLPLSRRLLRTRLSRAPDRHETGQGPHGHLFGDWGGARSRLLERGVRFDLQYVSDSLWNLKSEQPERFASWNRFRGTVDIDFEADRMA